MGISCYENKQEDGVYGNHTLKSEVGFMLFPLSEQILEVFKLVEVNNL
jgi:hypothetical protein